MKTCEVEGCEREYYAKGLCKFHYSRQPSQRQKKREYQREYLQRPEVKQKKREYQREYYQRPEVKQKKREYQREYLQRPEVKQKKKEYNQRPDVKQRKKERRRIHNDMRLGQNADRESIRELSKQKRKSRKQKGFLKTLNKLGFSEKTQKALVLDGVMLDKRMKELKNHVL